MRTWSDLVWAFVGGFVICAGAAAITVAMSNWRQTMLDRAARGGEEMKEEDESESAIRIDDQERIDG